MTMTGLVQGLAQRSAPSLNDFQRAIWRGMTLEQRTEALFSSAFDGTTLRALGVMFAIEAIEPHMHALAAELESFGNVERIDEDGTASRS